MLYTSYPSNASYSVAAGFENVPADHPCASRGPAAQSYAEKYGCRLMTVKEIFDGHGGLQPGHDAEKVGSQLRDFR